MTLTDRRRQGGSLLFVPEIVSPSSTERDEEEKLRAYDVLGACEYALFKPREDKKSPLVGYRRGESGQLGP